MPPKGFYNSSSRGQMKIETMSHREALNAVNALRRRDPSRTQEIEDLDAHLAALKVTYEAELRAEYPSADAGRQAEITAELTRLAGEA